MSPVDDGPEILSMIEIYRELEAGIRERVDAQRDLSTRIDAARLSARPTYPTDEQRNGVREAARRIRERIKPTSHHGEGTPTRAVLVTGHTGWLSINHEAPYNYVGGGVLWRFTDEEIDDLLDLVRAEDLEITSWWKHGNGISVTVLLG